ncbi:MAG: hypothetical protein H0V66_09985 [Bdellovibrionales bacterium]|nr:hypothetical protein [Bdellovibrionales bacterium]
MKLLVLGLMTSLIGCSSGVKVKQSVSAASYDNCKSTAELLHTISTTEGFDNNQQNEIRHSSPFAFFNKICRDDYIVYQYTQDEQDYLAVSKVKQDEYLPEEDSLVLNVKESEVDSTLSSFRSDLTTMLGSLNAKKEAVKKEERTFTCKTGEKTFKTKIFKAEGGYYNQIKAFIFIDDENGRPKEFPLKIKLSVDGFEPNLKLESYNETRSLFPENVIGSNSEDNEHRTENIKKFIALAKKQPLEGDYYSVPGKFTFSTESLCTSTEDIKISIHKDQIANYEGMVNEDSTFKNLKQQCLQESKSKAIQANSAAANVCKINACMSELNGLIKREQQIGRKSGYVNKMVIRRVGEYIHSYEEMKSKFVSVLKKNSADTGCHGFQVKKTHLFGNETYGYMCSVNILSQQKNLSDCAKALIGIDSEGKVNNGVDVFSKISNGEIDFASEAERFASSQVRANKEKEKTVTVEDPDVQVEKEKTRHKVTQMWNVQTLGQEFTDDEDNNYGY